MKLLLSQQPAQQPSHPVLPNNDVLRLAAEIFEGSGEWPTINLRDARLKHWNGQKISVAGSDLADLFARGLLDNDGGWTDDGRLELTRLADMAAPVAVALALP